MNPMLPHGMLPQDIDYEFMMMIVRLFVPVGTSKLEVKKHITCIGAGEHFFFYSHDESTKVLGSTCLRAPGLELHLCSNISTKCAQL